MKNIIKVNKEDFEIECSMSGVYSIEGYVKGENMVVWGGDSACEDHHDEDLAKEIFENWNGELVLAENWIGHEDQYVIEV